jgi:hypothetical protein
MNEIRLITTVFLVAFAAGFGGGAAPDILHGVLRPLYLNSVPRSLGSHLRDQYNILDFIPEKQHATIKNQTTTYDAYSALITAIDKLPPQGGIIDFPCGKLHINSTVHLKKYVYLRGCSSGMAGTAATVLDFADNITGFVVHGPTTDASGIAMAGGDASGSIFSHMQVLGNNWCARGQFGHGIHLRARATIEDTWVRGFSQDGIHIEASWNGDAATLGNANNWQIRTVRVSNNCANGILVKGSDANAGLGIGIDVSDNALWGISDESFLGNTWVGLHADTHGSGPYRTTGLNARSVFVGAYSESGTQPPAQISYPSMIIGGLLATGNVGTGMTLVNDQFSAFRQVNGTLQTRVGATEGTFMQFEEGEQRPYYLRYNTVDSTWDLVHGMLDGRVLWKWTGDNSTYQDESNTQIPAGNILFPNGVYIPSVTVPGKWRKLN